MLAPAAAGRGPAGRLHSKPPPEPRTLSAVSGSASSGPAVGWIFHKLDCGSWTLLLYREDSVPYDGRASCGPGASAVLAVSHASGCSVSGAGPVPGMLPHPSGPGTGGYAILTAACGKLSESACRGSAGMPLLQVPTQISSLFRQLDCGLWTLPPCWGHLVPYDGSAPDGPAAGVVPTVNCAGSCSVSCASPVPGMLPHPSGPGTCGMQY